MLGKVFKRDAACPQCLAASSRYSIKQPENKDPVWGKSGEAGPITLEVKTESIPHPVYFHAKPKVNFMLMQE